MPDLIGSSKAMRQIKDQIVRMIDTETHVLILGERGTGKEVVAKSIWNAHRKKLDKKFIAYDCGGFSPNLIASELFGSKKGAFTGADKDKEGLLEANDGKMIFLDEIGNIPRVNSGNAILDSSLAIRRSQAIANSNPPPAATPLIAAILT